MVHLAAVAGRCFFVLRPNSGTGSEGLKMKSPH